MPDIVPNLLHLSSEVRDVAELLEPALDLVLSATGMAFRRCELVWVNGPHVGIRFIAEKKKEKGHPGKDLTHAE